MRWTLLIFFNCFFVTAAILAQGENPFDLKNRTKKSAPTSEAAPTTPSTSEENPFDLEATSEKSPEEIPVSSEATENNSTVNPAAAGNPFDLRRNPVTQQNSANEVAVTAPPSSTTANPFDVAKEDQQKPTTTAPAVSSAIESSPLVVRKKAGKQEGQQQTFMFWTILSLLFTGTLVFVLFQPFLRKSYRAFTNDNMLKLLQRENGGSITFPYIILYTFFFVNAGIFIYLSGSHFGYVQENYGTFLIKCILGIAAFFVIKHLLLSFISAIFQVSKEIEQYTFTIVVFSIILGIVLVPFNVLTAFSTVTVSQLAFYSAFGMIVLFYLFRLFRSLFIASKFITSNKFHFFMYLCTIEIAPIAILVKVLMNSTGVQ